MNGFAQSLANGQFQSAGWSAVKGVINITKIAHIAKLASPTWKALAAASTLANAAVDDAKSLGIYDLAVKALLNKGVITEPDKIRLPQYEQNQTVTSMIGETIQQNFMQPVQNVIADNNIMSQKTMNTVSTVADGVAKTVGAIGAEATMIADLI